MRIKIVIPIEITLSDSKGCNNQRKIVFGTAQQCQIQYFKIDKNNKNFNLFLDMYTYHIEINLGRNVIAV